MVFFRLGEIDLIENDDEKTHFLIISLILNNSKKTNYTMT